MSERLYPFNILRRSVCLSQGCICHPLHETFEHRVMEPSGRRGSSLNWPNENWYNFLEEAEKKNYVTYHKISHCRILKPPGTNRAHQEIKCMSNKKIKKWALRFFITLTFPFMLHFWGNTRYYSVIIFGYCKGLLQGD